MRRGIMKPPRDIDLRLLESLVALVAERSVSRAAERMGISQPRMSNVLARLRAIFADPLLVRTKGEMAPTERALHIATSLRLGLSYFDAALEVQRPFDPAGEEDVHFVLAMSDYVSTLVIPGLMRRLSRTAPRVRLSIKMTDPARIRDWLAAGECDMAFGLFMHLGESLRASVLTDDSAICIVRTGHPLLERGLSREAFASASHAVMGGYPTPASTLEQMVESACAELGLARHVAIRAPSLVLLANIVANTDLIATIPRSVADQVQQHYGLQLASAPFSLPAMNITMVWHERDHRQPAHVWLRRQIRSMMKA
jgi:DNA-binding transcriptional LysR family regulator